MTKTKPSKPTKPSPADECRSLLTAWRVAVAVYQARTLDVQTTDKAHVAAEEAATRHLDQGTRADKAEAYAAVMRAEEVQGRAGSLVHTLEERLVAFVLAAHGHIAPPLPPRESFWGEWAAIAVIIDGVTIVVHPDNDPADAMLAVVEPANLLTLD